MLADVQILIVCNMISNSSGRIPLLIFCTYLQQQFFNVAEARTGEYKLPAQQQALPLQASYFYQISILIHNFFTGFGGQV